MTVSENEFDALWIEIANHSQHNMLCGVIYRHPNGRRF